MSDTIAGPTGAEETTVDDVRRVRTALARESGGDIRKHIAESNRLLAERREELGLKVAPPSSTPAAAATNTP